MDLIRKSYFPRLKIQIYEYKNMYSVTQYITNIDFRVTIKMSFFTKLTFAHCTESNTCVLIMCAQSYGHD